MVSTPQNASICSVFGSEARCQLESEGYALSPNETIDADYDCHCLDDKHEWAKCLDLALARQAARLTTLPTTTTTIATTSTTSTPTSTSRPAILLVPSSTLSPANEVFSKEVIKNELEREIEKGEQRGKFVASSSRKHPSNKTISIENRPDPEDYSTEKGSPEFPLTNIPTESEELSTPEFSATVSTPTTETPTFSRLPDLSPIFTKTTEESTTTTSDYQEEEENNGFETFTQIVPEVEEHRTPKFGVPVYSTFKPNTPSPWPTSSKSIEIGAGGQLIHSKELSGNEIVDITESTPMEKIPEEVIIEASTNPNFVVNRGSVDLGENVKTNQQPARNRENTGATTLTWIIAISAFVGTDFFI
uniref:Uncharacterized protein n=1 Tax=Acrobeloides nanus TaxID=290746 RepID=A0A914CZY7_9BILA